MDDKLPDSINFSHEEKVIIELWKKIDVFNNCLKQSMNNPRYTFYDGPPFATGLPHYGHILAGTIKDVVTRYFYIIICSLKLYEHFIYS
jgi:isoleucyl-tRNA synthetase